MNRVSPLAAGKGDVNGLTAAALTRAAVAVYQEEDGFQGVVVKTTSTQ
jgi:hypothetical protein